MSAADPVAVERTPTQLSGRTALLAAALGATAGGLLSSAGVVTGAAGVLLVASGLRRCSRLFLMGGSAMLVGGALLGGAASASALPVLVGVSAGAYAWLVGENAINLGEQVGRGASTRRVEAVHALSMGLLVFGTGAIGYLTYLASSPNRPQPLVLALLLSVVLLIYGSGKYVVDD